LLSVKISYLATRANS